MQREQKLIGLMAILVVSLRLHLARGIGAPPPDVAVGRTLALARAERQFAPDPDLLLHDEFVGPDEPITSYEHYEPAPFPRNGRSRLSNPSPIWEGESGFFLRRSGWGYSGRPRDWKNRYFFRMNTRRFDLGDARISWRYRSLDFGGEGYRVEAADAADLWLRLRTQYDLYVFQFDRTDDGMQVKRKLPAEGWSGPPALIANKGVYYTLPTDAAQPRLGAGQHLVPWNAVRDLLPESERAKPDFPDLAHDGITEYDFAVTMQNLPDATVRIQGYRSGVLVYSTTDDGRAGIAANGETQAEHVARNYFSTVPGWRPEWALPITQPGAVGFRADNLQLWITRFRVRTLLPAAAPAESAASGQSARDHPGMRSNDGTPAGS